MKSEFLTRSDLAQRWRKSPRTVARYQHDRPAGFPTPVLIGGRWHFRRGDVEAFEASLVAGSLREAA